MSDMPAVYRETIPETKVDGKPLGRHVVHDPRSHSFQVEQATALASVNHACRGLPLDQGQIGSCTGNALAGALNGQPNRQVAGAFTEHGAVRIYELETRLEGQPYPPNDPGGSGLMACKAGQQLGYVTSYQHAFNIQAALLALVVRPVITGVSWYDSFDAPDSSGRVAIAAQASVRGGHEICADEVIVPAGATIDDLDQILVGLWNSWGAQYGLGGKFYWTAATWNDLLGQQGDVTVPQR